MEIAPVFRRFCGGLHQDSGLFAKTEAELVAHCLELVPPAERTALRGFLDKALRRLTDAELKGLIRKAGAQRNFEPKAVRRLLDIAQQGLG